MLVAFVALIAMANDLIASSAGGWLGVAGLSLGRRSSAGSWPRWPS